jgi:asparagine N-glycosylation enzyme membrane subunit Stt3
LRLPSARLGPFGGKIRAIWSARPEIDLSDAIHYSSLVVILILALTIRLINFPSGVFLSEFDPFWHYRCAQEIVDSGLTGFFNWHDYISWYPYGRDAAASTPPGVPLTGAVIYMFLMWLGIRTSLLDVCINFPPFAGMLTALAVYLLGREVRGRTTGLFSALFLAFSGSHIDRTYLGFFKHETVGVLSIVVCTWLFLRAIRPQSQGKVIFYSILTGLWLGYLDISWTAYIFEVGLLSAFPIILLFLGRSKDELLPAFSITQGLAAVIALQVPRPGDTVITSIGFVPVIVAAVLLSLERVSRLSETWTAKLGLFLGIGGSGAVVLLYLSQAGLFSVLMGKLGAILDPLTRLQDPIVESVAEHKMSTWYSLFGDNGLLPVPAFFGMIAALRRPTNERLMSAFAWGCALYFGCLMVRIGLILAPFMAVMGALGIVELAEPALETYERGRRAPTYETGRGKRGGARQVAVGPELAALTIIVLLVFAGVSIYSAFDHAGVAVTIAGASLPVKQQIPDWLDALSWIRENTPPGSVTMAWWDYGYWITTMGERPTLADNATINTTQIAVIGRVFMSNDTVALPLLKKYNVSYVLVFTDIQYTTGSTTLPPVGDEVKWVWMAEIGYDIPPANVNSSFQNLYHYETLKRFADFDLGKQMASQSLLPKDSNGNSTIPLPKRDSVLTRLLVYGAYFNQYGQPSQSLVEPGLHFELAFRSTYGLVLIYKVQYDLLRAGSALSALSQQGVTRNETVANYNYTDVVGPGWSIDFQVSNSTALDGWADSAMTKRLNANAIIELSGSQGSVNWSAAAGEQKFIIESDVIKHYLNGTLQDIRPNTLGSGIKMELETRAQNAASFRSPALAVLKWGTITFTPVK